MESAVCSLDELLCQSLLLYRQHWLYEAHECEEKAYRIMEETRLLIASTQNGVEMAKWGCVVECLAQKFYIDSDTDAVLGDIDTALVKFWKKVDKTSSEAFAVYLWLGYYCLLRFRNGNSRYHGRSKQLMSALLTFLIETFRKIEKGMVSQEIFPLFSADVWGETVFWMEQVHGARLCEKQSAILLGQLYNLKSVELLQEHGKHDVLLQHILEFYCF